MLSPKVPSYISHFWSSSHVWKVPPYHRNFDSALGRCSSTRRRSGTYAWYAGSSTCATAIRMACCRWLTSTTMCWGSRTCPRAFVMSRLMRKRWSVHFHTHIPWFHYGKLPQESFYDRMSDLELQDNQGDDSLFGSTAGGSRRKKAVSDDEVRIGILCIEVYIDEDNMCMEFYTLIYTYSYTISWCG